MEVRVDGEVVASGEVSVGGDQPPQHNWRRTPLTLAPGPHTLIATSGKGEARAEATFDVPATRSVVVAFWHGRPPGSDVPGGLLTVEVGGAPAATM